MQRYRSAVAAAIVAVGAVTCVFIGVGKAQTQPQGRLPLEPPRQRGQSVTPAFEGWWKNADGTSTILLGYYNRNADEIIDVPIGPNNKIEQLNNGKVENPGPDFGQPTHFLLRREYGVFGIIVPANFGNRKLRWTLAANNQPMSIEVWLNPPYAVNPFENMANGNTPPTLRYTQTGESWQGPVNSKNVPTLSGTVNQPVALNLWVEDKGNTINPSGGPMPEPGAGRRGAATGAAGDSATGGAAAGRGGRGRGGRGARGAAAAGGGAAGAAGANAPAGGAGGRGNAQQAGRGGRGRGGPPAAMTIVWSKYRGPGDVKFSMERNPFPTGDLQNAETTATFAQPGEYWVRAAALDSSGNGGGGDQCCWSTAHFKVNVK